MARASNSWTAQMQRGLTRLYRNERYGAHKPDTILLARIRQSLRYIRGRGNRNPK